MNCLINCEYREICPLKNKRLSSKCMYQDLDVEGRKKYMPLRKKILDLRKSRGF